MIHKSLVILAIDSLLPQLVIHCQVQFSDHRLYIHISLSVCLIYKSDSFLLADSWELHTWMHNLLSIINQGLVRYNRSTVLHIINIETRMTLSHTLSQYLIPWFHSAVNLLSVLKLLDFFRDFFDLDLGCKSIWE